MDPITFSLVVLVSVLGGSFLGMALHSRLPEHQLSNRAEDVIKLGLGLITTMTALVLGLLISTAKGSYDLKRTQLAQIAADAILVDRSLAMYGSETEEARGALRNLVASLSAQIESSRGGLDKRRPSALKGEAADFYQIVRRLAPRDETQKALKSEVLNVSLEVGQIRALVLAQQTSSIPIPFLVVLIFWLTILFTGFGLFAPANSTVTVALCICGLSVSTAVFMILALDQPLAGFTHVSTDPLRNAMMAIGN